MVNTNAYDRIVRPEDRSLPSQESGERMALAIVLGYLVSLALLTAFIVWNDQQGHAHVSTITNVSNAPYSPGYRSDMWLPVFLLCLTLPVGVGGAIAGWIASRRSPRAAVVLSLLYVMSGATLVFEVEGPSVQYVETFSVEYLRFLMSLAELYAMVFSLSLLFAIPAAMVTGYLRRRHGR